MAARFSVDRRLPPRMPRQPERQSAVDCGGACRRQASYPSRDASGQWVLDRHRHYKPSVVCIVAGIQPVLASGPVQRAPAVPSMHVWRCASSSSCGEFLAARPEAAARGRIGRARQIALEHDAAPLTLLPRDRAAESPRAAPGCKGAPADRTPRQCRRFPRSGRGTSRPRDRRCAARPTGRGRRTDRTGRARP